MKNWLDFSNQVTPQGLISHGNMITDPQESKKLYLGKEGFKVLEKDEVTQGLLEITDEIFNEMIEYTEPKANESEKKLLSKISLRAPKKQSTKSLTFFQNQLKHHSTNKAPGEALHLGESGWCCITATDKPYNYTIHVLMEEGKIKKIPLAVNEKGIHVKFNNAKGEEILIKGERLHELLEDEDFPGNYFPYEQFGHRNKSENAIEKLYYTTILQKIPKGSEEFVGVEKPKSEELVFMGNRGTMVQSMDKKRYTYQEMTFAQGGFNILVKTVPHPSTLDPHPYLVGMRYNVESQHFTSDKEAQLQKDQEDFQRILYRLQQLKKECGPLKYCQIPMKISLKDPYTGDDMVMSMRVKAPVPSIGKFAGKLRPQDQLRFAQALFGGVKELYDHGYVKQDVSIDNFIAMSADPKVAVPLHIDFDEVIKTDEPMPDFLLYKQYWMVPSFERRINEKRMLGLPYGPALTYEDLISNQLYCIGRILHSLVTGKGFPYEEKYGSDRTVGTGDAPVEKVFQQSEALFKEVVHKRDGHFLRKPGDSLAHIIWDCIFTDRKDVISARPLTIDSVVRRVEKLISDSQGV